MGESRTLMNMDLYSAYRKYCGSSVVDMNDVVRKLVSLTEYQARSRQVSLSVSLSPDPLGIKANYFSLLRGAMYIMLEMMRSLEVHDGERAIEIVTSRENDRAVLLIRDTSGRCAEEGGHGQRQVLFPGHGGRGTGFPSAFRIFEEEGAEVTFREKGEGRVVTVSMPVVEPRSAPSRKALKVMVVDDDLVVLDVLDKYLDMLGCAGLTVSSPVKALEIIRKERFDVVMVDLRMPEMDGMKFINLVSEVFPVERCILLTGDIVSFDSELLKKRKGIKVIEKPVNFAKMRYALEPFMEE